MIRKNLPAWQYATYSEFHGSKANVVIHVITVPIFWAGLGILLSSVILLSWQRALLGAGLLLVPLVLQGIGHKQEEKPPIPFEGPDDFLSRFCVEQLVTFPRWIARRRAGGRQ